MNRFDDDATAALDALVDRLHADESRLRVWSIVITVFGDAIVPRGGMVGMGALQELTGRLRIEPSALRAAMSRLARDGWVERHRSGRRSHYSLAPASAATFARAARRIYAAAPPAWDGGWTVALAPEEDAAARQSRRAALADAGFVRLSAGLYVRPRPAPAGTSRTGGAPIDPPAGMFVIEGESPGLPAWIPGALSGAEIAADYERLAAAFAPLDTALESGATLGPLDAATARILLIHDWRRSVLRDPDLPAALRPPGWPGEDARALVARLYARLLGPSEAWLDTCEGRPGAALPPAEPYSARRFGGIGAR